MANKTFNTRVKNKRDTAANWEAVATTFQPLDGELIIVDTAAGKTRFKVGRYDTAKGRLLYYNEIPFTDEYLYNDLNESQGKIYDKLKGIDDKSIIESTLEPVSGADDKLYVYNIGLWQFPKTGFYKIKLTKVGALGILLNLYARITKDDGTTPDDWDNHNLKEMGIANGDGVIEEIYAQVDYINDDKFTVYRVQFFNCFGYLGSFWVNTYDKTTQKWAYIYKHRVTADHVSNKLTLTKGDTTTVYNGSVAREVSIPTKTSELTNDSFISYAEQTLTEGQQNQAKTNLGIDVLTGNTTTVTPTQVKEAILEGRPVAITYTDTTYGNLTFTSFGYSLENNVVVANLVATLNGQYILADLTGIINTNDWTLQTTELGTSTDIENNIATSITSSSTNRQYAGAKAVYDYVNDKIPNNSNIVNGKTTGSLVMINASDGDIMFSPGKNSFSGGEGTLASGSASHTEGYYTSAQGDYSHAEGSTSIASGEAAHAEGYSTNAMGHSSHAEGRGSNDIPSSITTSTNKDTIITTWETTKFNLAKYDQCHTEGDDTLALDSCAHAEGYETIAAGGYSHSEGYKTRAMGTFTHTEGEGTIASSANQHVQGRYNIEDSNSKYLHIVGNGNSNTNRSNAHTVDNNGNGWFAGTIEGTALILKSSTPNSTKRFRITVDDSGTISATAIN